jgi:glycosyltransferase involved in cell wall biosynthesis
MKILFICDEYPYGNNGGIGTTVQNLSREYVKLGHEVFVVGLYAYRYKGQNYFVDQGVKVWRYRYGINLPLASSSKLFTALERLPNFIKSRLNGKVAFQRFIKFLNELITDKGISVAEIADFNNFAMYIGFNVDYPKLNIPLIVKIHGSYTYFAHEMNQVAKPFYRETDRLLFARADAFSAVSAYAADRTRQLFNIKQPIKVIYNGIKIPDYAPHRAQSKKKIIFSGTLVEKKGIFSLMKAWNMVHKKHKDAELLVFGKGNTRLLKGMLDSEAGKTVFFRGHILRDQLMQELKEATAAVFPSYSETFGMGVIEAMSESCAVIYTKRSCGPEIIEDGKEGLLIDPDKIEELASAICKIIENEELRVAIAKNAYAKVKTNYEISHSAKENLAFYETTISDFAIDKKN